MLQILYIIILTLLAIGLAIFLLALQIARREETSVVEEVVGICTSAFEQTTQKEENKKKVLEFLETSGGESGNKEIREHLNVSRRSVVNYMDELEREGKTEQVGGIGRGVVYRIKK